MMKLGCADPTMEKTMAASAAAVKGGVGADLGCAAAEGAAVVAPVTDVKGKAVDASGSAELQATGGATFVDDAGGSDGAAKAPFKGGLSPYDQGYYADECGRQLKKFENGELRVMKKGKYTCPFCPNKIKAGDRKSLEMHALDIRHQAQEMKDRADHQVLAPVLYGDDLPPYGWPSKKAKFI